VLPRIPSPCSPEAKNAAQNPPAIAQWGDNEMASVVVIFVVIIIVGREHHHHHRKYRRVGGRALPKGFHHPTAHKCRSFHTRRGSLSMERPTHTALVLLAAGPQNSDQLSLLRVQVPRPVRVVRVQQLLQVVQVMPRRQLISKISLDRLIQLPKRVLLAIRLHCKHSRHG
jgi:hypothetical protein